jgi:uncharacterized protein DUF6676
VRFIGVLVVVAALLQGAASAHAPVTAIGRAVTAFGALSVSYDQGAVVSDVEAGGFPQIVGSDPKVAFMPASANTEIQGGPDAVADEIAREAGLEGTLIVLVGNQLGTWSEDIGQDRLAALVDATPQTGSRAAAVESLVRAVHAEPKDWDPPWGWLAAGMAVVAAVALVALDRSVRRRP